MSIEFSCTFDNSEILLFVLQQSFHGGPPSFDDFWYAFKLSSSSYFIVLSFLSWRYLIFRTMWVPSVGRVAPYEDVDHVWSGVLWSERHPISPPSHLPACLTSTFDDLSSEVHRAFQPRSSSLSLIDTYLPTLTCPGLIFAHSWWWLISELILIL